MPGRPELQILEIVGLIRLLRDAPDLEYSFRHALTQEAAYALLTRRNRQALHETIGEIVESFNAGRLDEVAAVLAYHYAAAGTWEKAVPYTLVAARRSLSTYAYPEAILQLQRALDALGSNGPAPFRLALLEALGDAHTLTREGMLAVGCFQRALEAWNTTPAADRESAIRLHRKILLVAAEIRWSVRRGEFLGIHHAVQAAEDNLESALELIRDRPEHPETVRLLSVLSFSAWRLRSPPDWEASVRHAEAAEQIAARISSPVELSLAQEALANAFFGRGQLAESLAAAERRLEITSQPGFPDEREHLDALRGAACALIYLGEYDRAIPLALQAEQIAQRIQSVDQIFNSMALLTHCWFRLDRWQEIRARRPLWDDFEQRYPTERTGPACWPQALRSIVYRLSGDVETAVDLRQRSYATMIDLFGEDQWLRNAHY